MANFLHIAGLLLAASSAAAQGPLAAYTCPPITVTVTSTANRVGRPVAFTLTGPANTEMMVTIQEGDRFYRSSALLAIGPSGSVKGSLQLPADVNQLNTLRVVARTAHNTPQRQGWSCNFPSIPFKIIGNPAAGSDRCLGWRINVPSSNFALRNNANVAFNVTLGPSMRSLSPPHLESFAPTNGPSTDWLMNTPVRNTVSSQVVGSAQTVNVAAGQRYRLMFTATEDSPSGRTTCILRGAFVRAI